MPVMPRVALIAGSGLAKLNDFRVRMRRVVRTPYGEPSGPLIEGDFFGHEVIFLARHGQDHRIPPHLVNYRANLWGLKEFGVDTVIAVAAVGAIQSDLEVGGLAFPDQILDYTHTREHTFCDHRSKSVLHVDFSLPYCETLRAQLIASAAAMNLSVNSHCTYAATQGPRLETAAEIDRLERDGADVVGMTGMPEAALAREIELSYATIAVISNSAAGRGGAALSMETIYNVLQLGMDKVHQLLPGVLGRLET
jgi:5'-deoxy-5'-methylthioadenosine phosphorylase